MADAAKKGAAASPAAGEDELAGEALAAAEELAAAEAAEAAAAADEQVAEPSAPAAGPLGGEESQADGHDHHDHHHDEDDDGNGGSGSDDPAALADAEPPALPKGDAGLLGGKEGEEDGKPSLEQPPPPPPPSTLIDPPALQLLHHTDEEEPEDRLIVNILRIAPPSPRSLELSAKAGKKGVGVLKFLDLHQMIANHMQPNVRGERDFKALCNLTKQGDNSEQMQRLLKNLRQEVKKLYGERRKRKQLMAWDKLEQAVGIRDPRDPSKKRLDNVDPEAVVKKAILVEDLVSKWFMDRSVFDDYFIRELSVHLIGLLARGEKSPGSVLGMPPCVIEKILHLHRTRCKDRFHELHRMFFSDLFTPADIEIAVLSVCNCETCVSDWDVKSIEQRKLDPHVRLHWTKQKAKQAAYLLRAHLKFANEVGTQLAGKGAPRMRSWSDMDFRGVLRSIHTCTSCYMCQKIQARRYAPPSATSLVAAKIEKPLTLSSDVGAEDGEAAEGEVASESNLDEEGAAASAPADTAEDGGASQGTGQSAQNELIIPLPATASCNLSVNETKFTKRLKDMPQMRPLGLGAKRKIRLALAEQSSKVPKVVQQDSSNAEDMELEEASSPPPAAQAIPQALEDDNHREMEAYIEEGLQNPSVLRILLSNGALSSAGVTCNAAGAVELSKPAPPKKRSGRARPVQKLPERIPALDQSQIEQIIHAIHEAKVLSAVHESVQGAIETSKAGLSTLI